MTDALAAFLRARLDDDEAGADADAFPPPGYADADRQARGFRMLAEVEAKRAVLDLYVASRERDEWMREASGTASLRLATSAYLEAVKRLALPHADHPDYRQDWRP